MARSPHSTHGLDPRPSFSVGTLTAIFIVTSALMVGRVQPRLSTADSNLPLPVAIRAIDPRAVEVPIPGSGLQQVRMVGIDAARPEVQSQDTGCVADEAKRFIQTRVPGGSPVVLIADPTHPDRDTDGRLLRHLIIDTDPNAPPVPDAVPNPMVRAPVNLGYLLVAGGYARVREP